MTGAPKTGRPDASQPDARPDVGSNSLRAEKHQDTAPYRGRDARSGAKLKSVSQYLRQVPHRYRAKVRALYRSRGGFKGSRFNDGKRALLAGCVFEVADELEHRHADTGKQPGAVAALFDALNRLYDDLGVNE